MTLYTLFFDNKDYLQCRDDPALGSTALNLEIILETLNTEQQYLRSLAITDLLGFFGEVCKQWSQREHNIQKKLGPYGLNFLLYWLRPENLKQVIQTSLREDMTVLDDFQQASFAPYSLIAQPRGVIGHWLAGNVPMLGMLSLIQGILSKNANILKVSSQNAWVLPLLLKSLSEIKYQSQGGMCIQGTNIVRSVAAIYFKSDATLLQESLSQAVQVRVAWGGAESVQSIMNTPRKYGTDDVIFGPKTSLALVGKECLSDSEQAKQIAKLVVADVVAFDQQGCNAPHTLFVEKGGAVNGQVFAGIVAETFKMQISRQGLSQPGPQDSFEILSKRIEYDMRGSALYARSFDWTVLYAEEDQGLAEPCYYRTLFVRPVEDIMNIADYCTHWTQSVGVALSAARKKAFAKIVSAAGVDRVPDVGRMSLYEIPWDGIFVMDRFVRWCKLDMSYDFTPSLEK